VKLLGLAPGVLSSSPLARALAHEGEVLSKLDHPNILRLFDLKRDDSELWLVLEEVDGPLLSELPYGELSWQGAAAIGLDIARALVHAHSVGEIHGHLNADAVQFTAEGRTKLSAFGQGQGPKDEQVEALEPHRTGGLSPEGSIGQTVGPLSDLFAWGALMYELLTQTPPFGSPDDSHYASRVRNDRPKALLLKRPDLPAALDHLINQCLEKLPSARPVNAEVLTEQLEALIGSATLPLIRAELIRLGKGPPGASPEDASYIPAPLLAQGGKAKPQLFTRLVVPIATGVLGALLALTVFSLIERRSEQQKAALPVERQLPAEEALLLRVVASPWAHVLVDGKHRETTPFATPIPLTPGKHVVRLEHPSAAPEERIVEGRAGQAVLLNVQMHVEKPLSLELPAQAAEETSP
jgi:serine/threonine protein kinase